MLRLRTKVGRSKNIWMLQRLLSNFSACDSDFSCQIKISIYIFFFIFKPLDYPELNIPKLDPYTSDSPFVINLRRASLPINLVANCSNISIHGLDKIEIVQIKYVYKYSFSMISLSFIHNSMRRVDLNRGIAPNLKYTTIEANVFVPAITLNAGYTSNSNLFLLRKTTEGVTNVNLSMPIHFIFRFLLAYSCTAYIVVIMNSQC